MIICWESKLIHSKKNPVVWVACVFLGLMLIFGFENPILAALVSKKATKSNGLTSLQTEPQNKEGFNRVLKVWEEQNKKYVFIPTGRNDPFFPIIFPEGPGTTKPKPGKSLTPLQKLDLSSIKLVAIVSSGKDARALVEDSTGMGYIIKVGTYIGINNGKVIGIYPASIVYRNGVPEIEKPGRIEVSEKYRTYFGTTKTRVVTIPLKGEEK